MPKAFFVDDSSDSALSQLSSTSKVSVSLRMTARSTTFCYSRMHFGSEWNSLGQYLATLLGDAIQIVRMAASL